MAFWEGVIDRLAPGWALSREEARMRLTVLREAGATMRYDAATAGNRSSSWRPVAGSADAVAAASRARLAGVARDMIRNTPFATRAQQVITNNVIGDGIIPKVIADRPTHRKSLMAAIEAHCDTTAIDRHGRCTLYGLQRLALNTVIDAGEALLRRRPVPGRAAGLALPFQVEVLEPEHLDRAMHGSLSNGNEVDEGIEYDAAGRVVAYWLFPQHPGANIWGRRMESERVEARDVLHVFRQDRPGQRRGVSWFAPIALPLQDMADHQDAQLMRQKIAACFAAFRITSEPPEHVAGQTAQQAEAKALGKLIPGRIQDLPPGEDIKFGDPPGVEGYDEFTRNVLRSVAAGLGVTYEALSGDLSNVNFTSMRVGKIEMMSNVSSWQYQMAIPQMCQPLGRWILEGWQLMQMRPVDSVSLGWVPPRVPLLEPGREIDAYTKKVRAGFTSRSQVIRELGFDPERVMDDIQEDARDADHRRLTFDSDPRRAGAAGAPSVPAQDQSAAQARQDKEIEEDAGE